MQHINRNNYEAFFLDYHEGNLSDGLKKELFLFLDNYPDLKVEFEGFEMIAVSGTAKMFFDKERLKKNTITLHNYKSYFVAYIENDLSLLKKNEVDLFIQKNPLLKPEFELFNRVKIVPDVSVVFRNKKQLNRGGKIIVFTPPIYRIAIAASIALFIITYFLLRNTNEKNIAHQETPKTGTERNHASPSNSHSYIDPNMNAENKKGLVQKNRDVKEKLHDKKSTPSTIDYPIRANEPKTIEPLLSQQNEKENSNPVVHQNSTEKKDSFENRLVDNNTSEQKPFKPEEAQLSEVFSDDDLKELGVSSHVSPDKKNSLWDLASKGARELSKVTRTDITLSKQSDELENTNSYALAIGNFSISHTANR